MIRVDRSNEVSLGGSDTFTPFSAHQLRDLFEGHTDISSVKGQELPPGFRPANELLSDDHSASGRVDVSGPGMHDTAHSSQHGVGATRFEGVGPAPAAGPATVDRRDAAPVRSSTIAEEQRQRDRYEFSLLGRMQTLEQSGQPSEALASALFEYSGFLRANGRSAEAVPLLERQLAVETQLGRTPEERARLCDSILFALRESNAPIEVIDAYTAQAQILRSLEGVRNFSPEQVCALRDQQFRELSASDIARISPEALAALGGRFALLCPDQLSRLTPPQIELLRSRGIFPTN